MVSLQGYPYIQNFFCSIKEMSGLQSKRMEEYLQEMDSNDKIALEKRLEYLVLAERNTMEQVVGSYMAWCLYFMEERKYFVQNGSQYRYHSYAEISHLYEDSQYMKNYMIGLSIAAYLWNIQRKNLNFFKEYCKRDTHSGGKYLEIGPGHGEYLCTAAENTRFEAYKAVDISPSAARQTKDFLDYYYKSRPEILRRISVECQDFFLMDEQEKYDAIVISQVIEHVERPGEFLCKAKALANTGALVYVSTAINSPFPDHIYHFHNKAEVVQMVEKAGFVIMDEFQSVSDGMSLERAVRKGYDIIIGFILR